MPDQIVQQRRIQDGGGVELLPGNSGADDGEDAGANDRADAESGEGDGPKRLFQRVFRTL